MFIPDSVGSKPKFTADPNGAGTHTVWYFVTHWNLHRFYVFIPDSVDQNQSSQQIKTVLGPIPFATLLHILSLSLSFSLSLSITNGKYGTFLGKLNILDILLQHADRVIRNFCKFVMTINWSVFLSIKYYVRSFVKIALSLNHVAHVPHHVSYSGTHTVHCFATHFRQNCLFSESVGSCSLLKRSSPRIQPLCHC